MNLGDGPDSVGTATLREPLLQEGSSDTGVGLSPPGSASSALVLQGAFHAASVQGTDSGLCPFSLVFAHRLEALTAEDGGRGQEARGCPDPFLSQPRGLR